LLTNATISPLELDEDVYESLRPLNAIWLMNTDLELDTVAAIAVDKVTHALDCTVPSSPLAEVARLGSNCETWITADPTSEMEDDVIKIVIAEASSIPPTPLLTLAPPELDTVLNGGRSLTIRGMPEPYRGRFQTGVNDRACPKSVEVVWNPVMVTVSLYPCETDVTE